MERELSCKKSGALRREDALSRAGEAQGRITTEKVAILLEQLPENRIGWSIRLLLGTGMRSQELLALEPHHIPPDGSVIHIEQAINIQKSTATIGVPKSRVLSATRI